MSVDDEFRVLVSRVRAGEETAAADLVRQYEPEIRRAVRVRLTDPRLRRTLDSVDICQSVLANFFVRAAAGQFELERPEELLKLLVTMAHNKLRDKVRRQQAGRRDVRRVDAAGPGLSAVSGGEGTPSRIIAGRDLLRAVHEQMSDDERALADRRADGREWADIAAELGGTPDALRKKLTRALDRIMRKLGLDETDHA